MNEELKVAPQAISGFIRDEMPFVPDSSLLLFIFHWETFYMYHLIPCETPCFYKLLSLANKGRNLPVTFTCCRSAKTEGLKKQPRKISGPYSLSARSLTKSH